jgi:hypothetical protein
MDYVMAMCIAQRIRHLTGNAHRIVQRELLLAFQPIPQGLTLDIGHDVEEESPSLTRIVER